MRWRGALLAAATTVSLLIGAARPADARATAAIESVTWEDPPSIEREERRVRKAIRRFAASSMKGLDFGRTKKAEIDLVLKELEWVESNGVLTVSCTLVGKLKGGGRARSRLKFGGHPKNKKQLERQILAAVTDGVMSRLSELSRARERESRARHRAEAEADLEAARAEPSRSESSGAEATTERARSEPEAQERAPKR